MLLKKDYPILSKAEAMEWDAARAYLHSLVGPERAAFEIEATRLLFNVTRAMKPFIDGLGPAIDAASKAFSDWAGKLPVEVREELLKGAKHD